MKTSITMRGKSFVPPPRSVDDILNVIDREAKKDALDLKNWERQFKNKLPENATRNELIEFYFKRGEAAFNFGFFQQSRDDYQKAYEMAGPDNAGPGLKMRLAYSELNLQNYEKAIDVFTSAQVRIHHFHPYAELTNIYALTGDFEKAEDMCKRGRLVSNHHSTSWSDSEVFFKSRLEYTVLNMKAKYEEAEPFIRRAQYAAIASRRDRYEDHNIRIDLVRNLINQNRLVEAELEARAIIDKSTHFYKNKSTYSIEAITTLSEVLLSQGRVTDAERVCRASLQAFEQLGIPSMSAYYSQAINTLGNILIAKGDYPAAIEEFDLFLDVKDTNRHIYDRFYRRNYNVMLALIMTGRSAEAMELIESAYQSSEKLLGERHSLSAELLGSQRCYRSVLILAV